MKFLLPWVLIATAQAQNQPPAPTTASAPDQSVVRAELLGERPAIQTGRPIWVRLVLTNLTADAVTLKPPDAVIAPQPPSNDQDPPEMGLPLAHVFSGARYSAVSVKDERGEEWDKDVSLPPRGPVLAIRLAPHASVGLRLDLLQYYSSLKHPGKYTLVWRPYGGALVSAPFTLTVLPERQAIINTDLGKMTVRFYFDEAPLTVENFIDLVDKHFYDKLTFHRIVPHALIQGGDPTGTGTGERRDRKRIKAEFSKIPFEAGTVGMARLQKDPDSASCQFFITAARQPGLDGNQTAFGYLVDPESFHTLDKLMAVTTDDKGRPLQPVYIRSIRLENVPTRDSSGAGGEPKTPTTRPTIITDAARGSTSGSGSSSPGSGSSTPGSGGGSSNPGPTTRPAPGTD